MTKKLTWVLAVLLGAALVGCGEERTEAAATAETEQAAIPEMTVEQVASMLADDRGVVLDANRDQTRSEQGIVPGARLLTSSSRYDVANELPSDKATTLVFYCANTRCTASDAAAERARDAGWSDVHVMRAGIAGWREAGRPTERVPTS